MQIECYDLSGKDLHIDGIMRLVEGIILGVLDKVSISGKWINRDISLHTLEEKMQMLCEMKDWMKSTKWENWLDIYCNHFSRNKIGIKRNFERIRRKSVRYVKKRIKDKLTEISMSS